MAFGDRRRARRRRTLKVRRVIRRIELRSALKLGLIFHACCYGVTLGVGALLWRLALRYDLVHNLEKFMAQIGFADDFRIDGPTLWRVAVRGGAILVALNVIITLLAAFFYNCVAGLIGGVVVSMLEDAPLARRPVSASGSDQAGDPGATASGAAARPDAATRRGTAKGAQASIETDEAPTSRRRAERRRARKAGKSGQAPGPTDDVPDFEDPTLAVGIAMESTPVLVDWADAFGPASEGSNIEAGATRARDR